MSDGGGELALLLAGPAGGTALYWMLYRFYRNTDKSHSFEHETAVDAKPITGDENKVGTNNGTQQTRISGDNVHDFRKRVERIQTDSS